MSEARVTLDISEPPGAYGDEATLPAPTVLSDEGVVVLAMANVEIRMTYVQFEQLYRGMRRWITRKPPTSPFVVYDEEL